MSLAEFFDAEEAEPFVLAFEEQVRAKVGHSHSLAMPDREPEWADFADLFEPTRAGRLGAMRAAGFDKAGRPLPRKGTEARRRRDAYRRRVERYLTSAGERRRPAKLQPRERRVVRAQWKRRATPHSARAVLELCWLWGVTVTELVAAFDYEPTRMRHLDNFSVGVRPAVLRRAGFYRALIRANPIEWQELADAFLLAYGRAYGMGDFAAGGSDDTRRLRFRVGFTDAAQYQYGSTSRPPGARNRPAGAPKYRGTGRR